MGPFDRGGAALRVRPHNGARPKMQKFVKNVNNETSTLDLESSASVLSVKQLLAARENISVEDQLLSFDGLTLDDDSSLADAGVQKESILYISLRLLGGGKKKKKKNYTTPKKTKRKHKKVKLAVLTYYKVDENGKITRIRRECETCGAGVFMANHFDRQYCGKCGLTY